MAAGLAMLAVWAARPALAVDYSLVRWKKTGQCEIVTRLPLWGDHWVRLGDYGSKAEAERALTKLRRAKACPADKSAKRAEVPPDRAKPPVTYRGGRANNVQGR